MKRLIAALGALACVGTPSVAADLGGNCCADLEERVAELEATTARKGNRKVSLTVYGQVNAALLWHDVDGVEDKVITQNGSSTSRIGVRGEAKINATTKAGYVIEVGLDQIGSPRAPASDLDLSVRHSALYIEGPIGRVTLGHTSQATDTLDEIVVPNTAVASKLLSIQPFGNAYLGGMDLPFDGGRRDVLRYDSPSMGGFVASAAWAGDDEWDAALRYAGEFGGFKVAAGVGYREVKSDDAKTFMATGSIQHVASGIFAQGSYGRVQVDGFDDLTGYHIQGGIEAPVFATLGKMTFYGEWARLEEDGDVDMFGGGIVQAIDAAAMDIYVGYRQYDIDSEAVQTVVGGARIKF